MIICYNCIKGFQQMSVFTAIINIQRCTHCGGTGYIEEFIECPDCEGQCCQHPTLYGECCVACEGGQLQVSSTLCHFCDNEKMSYTEQFESTDVDGCVAMLKTKLNQLFNYDSSEDDEFLLDEPKSFDNRRNVWWVDLSDKQNRFECFIVKTNIS